ncbi:hypothetical protein TanjilG_16260 [Lupinus angustifolius]|uniref:Uncharacterized protein n=1 Tax=Lupinus angustifolius TaxID=3871 RepID=A0A1J7I2P8_LUPAN|nr:hypothetical protein TanjilG_16260 [Lupinus angustifolius]
MTIGSIEKQGAEESEGDMKHEAIEECKTPTRSSNQIPAILTCPPAPRKKKREKLSAFELSFFEDINAEEIDVFFKSMYEFTRANKKCKSI